MCLLLRLWKAYAEFKVLPTRVAAGSAALLAEMKKTGTTLPWFGSEPLRSATSMMAMAQWAMNARLSVEQRYTFAQAILDIVDDPSFKPSPTRLFSLDFGIGSGLLE